MRIAVGSDHRGIAIKRLVLRLIEEAGHTGDDLGAYSSEAVDYPDIAAKVARQVIAGKYDRGVLICGTGIGMCIAANKVKGIRAAPCHDAFTAERARQHNDAQICCLGAEEGEAAVPSILNKFLTTEYEGGRHQARLDKIKKIEDSV